LRKGDDVADSSILLLSAVPVVRSVIKETLEHAGYIVMATDDIGKAVEGLNEYIPDLLIVHPYVDGLTGLEAAKYLKTKCPTMHVLIVAGLLDDDRLENPIEQQGFTLFPKPFTADQLLAEVKEVLSTVGILPGLSSFPPRQVRS
jgi:DNA-binding NtrC family response regulator